MASPRKPLRGYAVSAPDTWLGLPLDPDPGWEVDILSRLTIPEHRRAGLHRDLTTMHAALTEIPHIGIGVWIPDPEVPQICGAMAVDLISPSPKNPVVDLDEYHRLLLTTHRRGIKVLSREIRRGEVPAGPCLIIIETVRMRWRSIEHHAIYSVFPETSTDALELTFVTPHGSMADALTEDAATIVRTLTLDTQFS